MSQNVLIVFTDYKTETDNSFSDLQKEAQKIFGNSKTNTPDYPFFNSKLVKAFTIYSDEENQEDIKAFIKYIRQYNKHKPQNRKYRYLEITI